jgi:hypothetical protein
MSLEVNHARRKLNIRLQEFCTNITKNCGET